MGTGRELDHEVQLARLQPRPDPLAEPAIRVDDTKRWFRTYGLSGIGLLVLGALVMFVGGMWVLSELREPKYDYEHRTLSVPCSTVDPFGGSNDPFGGSNSPFGGANDPTRITLPGGLCLTEQSFDIRTKNTFNKFSLYPFAFGVTGFGIGVMMVVRALRWRRIATSSPWIAARLLAVRIERRKESLVVLRLDGGDRAAVLRLRSANVYRAGRLGADAVQVLTDGAGNWLMRFPGQTYPFLLWEPETAKQLVAWHQWEVWPSFAASHPTGDAADGSRHAKPGATPDVVPYSSGSRSPVVAPRPSGSHAGPSPSRSTEI